MNASPSAPLTLAQHVAIAKDHPEDCLCAPCTYVFDVASDHRYECKCEACAIWWKRVPPEDQDD